MSTSQGKPRFFRRGKRERPEIEEVRKTLLDKLLAVFSLLGLPAVAVGATQVYIQGRWVFSIVYVGIYLLFLGAAFTSRQLSYRFRALILIFSLYLIGVVILIRIGMSGVGLQLMLGVGFLAAVLFGFRTGVFAILVILASICFVAVGMTTGFIHIYPEHMLTSRSGAAWFTAVLVFFMILSITVIAPEMLRMRIEDSLDLLEAQRKDLEAANESLRQEIRERGEIEATLRQSEKRFEVFMDHLPAAAFMKDEGGQVLYANRFLMDLFGWEDTEGKSTFDLLPPGMADKMVADDRAVLAGGPATISERITDCQGREHFFETRKFPIRIEGRPPLLGGISVDITDRKQAESTLRESEERYQAMIRNSSDVVTVLTADGVSTYQSPAIKRILGYEPEEHTGVNGFDYVHPDDLPATRLAFSTVIEQGGITSPVEYRYRRADGSWLYMEGIASNHLDDPAIKGVIVNARGISERKRAEEALRESAEEYRLITSTAMDGFVISDQDGRLLDVNEAYCQMVNYSRDELLKMSIADIDAIDTPEEIDRRIHQIMESGADRFETRHRRKDGRIIDVEVSLTFMHRTGRQLAFLRDVTERKQAEEALRQANLIVENSPVVLFRWKADEGWPVELVSKNVTQFGYEPEELLSGKVPFSSMVHPEDLNRVACEVQDYGDHGVDQFQQEYRLVTKDEKVRWVDDRTVIGRDTDGRITHYQGIVIDITERKQAEEALEKRIVALTQPLDSAEGIAFDDLFNLSDMQHLQDLFAKAFGVAALITHPDGTPITQPSNFSELCGEIIRKTPKGVINCNHSDAVIGRHNPSGPNIRRCLSAGLCNAGASITVGGRHVANFLIGQVRNEAQDEEEIMKYAREIGADETAFRAAYRKVPVMSQEQFDSVAHVLFAVAAQISNSAYQNVQQARFIADRKRAEAELARHRDHLEEIVRERTKELEAAQEELIKRERLSVLGQLTATVSHELRNPLGVIRSSAFYLKKQVKDGDEKIRKHLNRIEAQVELCDKIVGELLEYTRGRVSEMAESEIRVWLGKVLKEARGTEGIRITRAFSGDLPKVLFDPGKMGRVMRNLLDNAIHAVRERQNRIEADGGLYEPEIRVSATCAESGVKIEIEDNGVGMDEETVRRAFEPLFTTKARGTGLGLAIVKKIVEEHGGTMRLESQLHGGTKAILWIPVRQGAI
jgi:PAS domain S-box-containing protein